MGRELRKVIPNWKHPQEEKYDPFRRQNNTVYKPLFDQSCEEAWRDWQSGFEEWIDTEHDRVRGEYGDLEYPKDQPYTTYCKWDGMPPDPEFYRPAWKPDEATWYQVYETVSEGTPVTPPFATKEELVEYLVKNGDFWDQKRRKEGNIFINCSPWPRAQAESFVFGSGWAPSFVMTDGVMQSGVEAMAER